MTYFQSMRDMVPYVDPTNILTFFSKEPYKHLQSIDMQKGVGYECPDFSLFDYMQKVVPKKYAYSNEFNGKYHNALLKIAQKLVNEGLLSPVGENSGIYQKYRSNGGISDELLDYGYYDFLIFGFPEIKNHFEEAIRPIVLKDITTKDESIGTSFAILFNYEKQYLVTARHCLPENNIIAFEPFLPKENTTPINVFIPKDDKIDIAILEFSDKLLLSNKFFKIDKPYLLDNVMTIGYPPIQGVKDAVQISSTGEITAITETYWHKEEQILISSRVKGGNSGSPVINNCGYVVGILTNTLIDPKDNSKPDELGFGLALSSLTLINLLESINGKGEMEFKKMKIKEEISGFSVTETE